MDDVLQETLSTSINRAFDNLIEYGESITYFIDEIEVAASELIADHRKLKLVSNMAIDFIAAAGLHGVFSDFVRELKDNAPEGNESNVIPFIKK